MIEPRRKLSSFILALIWKYLSTSSNILTLSCFSAQPATITSRGSYNCYKGASLATSFCEAYLFFQLTAVTKHCLAICWLPLTVTTPCSVGNLTFTCKVDRITLIAWIHGLPRIAVYGENELTTMNAATTTSLPFIYTRREIQPLGITTLPSNPTKPLSV